MAISLGIIAPLQSSYRYKKRGSIAAKRGSPVTAYHAAESLADELVECLLILHPSGGSVDEVAPIRDTRRHYAPVLIALFQSEFVGPRPENLEPAPAGWKKRNPCRQMADPIAFAKV
jgi:hypothetical protein